MSDGRAPETSVSLLMELCRDAPAPESWARFVSLYGPVIARWCRGRRLAEADAEDVAQAVFCLLLRHLPAFRYDPGRGGFRAWLKTITLRQVCSFLRGEARHRLAPVLGAEPAAGGDLVRSIVERDLLATAFARARAACDPLDWRAFDATKLQGRSPAEAAGELGIAVAEVSRASYRVKLLVARELESLERHEAPEHD